MRIIRYCLLLCAVALLTAAVQRIADDQANDAMLQAATGFLAALEPDRRAKAQFQLTDAERLNWHFIPRERKGLPLKEMTPAQRELAHALLKTGLSQRGILKAHTIIELELVLREMGGSAIVRDPELYFFSIFGTPSAREPWGWRMEGHHMSLNFTVVDGKPVATSPSFLGANPAEVRVGTRKGLRALAPEEDLAREFMTSLNPEQRAAAIITAEAPRDIITMNAGGVQPLTPTGIAVSRLDPRQKQLLLHVVDEYLARMADGIAAERKARLQRSDFDQVTFAWAGSTDKGAPHYYRIQGPSFLIEYDNTQNDANHIHSVWRDFAGDFGRDLLREHYQQAPHPR